MKQLFKITTYSIIIILSFSLSVSAWPIPDTGQTKCYNDTVEIPCPKEGEPFYGQDGNYLINPQSYTKLDAQGKDLPDSATTWVMVRDNVTGLIWEMKTDDGSVHDKDNTYTWQDAQDVFIPQLNSQKFGGFSDWRMPTIKELASIVNLGSYYPAINTEYFPNTQTSYYWSSSTYADYTGLAWNVNFSNGYDDNGNKSSSYYVRAVRSGQLVLRSFDHLIINGDGTVTDTSTGLMWQQSNPGQMTWRNALSNCESLSLAGYSDWRLPTSEELRSIADYSRYYPAIDTTYFPGTQASYYWSSSTNATSTGSAWRVGFGYGYDGYDDKSSSYYVRAVRSGQIRLFGHLIILSPSQGSFSEIGKTQIITWDTAGISGNIKISLSRQGGKDGTFETIVDNTPNDGSYTWTVTGTASFNCALKIEPVSEPAKRTVQGLFSIIMGSCTLAPPKNLQTTPLPETCSVSNMVIANWSPGVDCGKGIAGYSYIWDTHPTTVPDNIVDTTAVTVASPPLSDGNSYYLHVCAVDDAGNKSDAVHAGPFYLTTPELERKKAIIIAGGGSQSSNFIWDRTKLNADYAYRVLLSQGYCKGNIYYLNPEQNRDVDGNGRYDDVTGDAVLDNLKYALTSWASDADELLIYMVDHGDDGIFYINDHETISADDLKIYLDMLPAKVKFVYDACKSGSFIQKLIPPKGQERILITSSEIDKNGYFLEEGRLSFSFQFWAAVFGGAKLNIAFDFARNMMRQYQTPLTDVNGSGKYDENEEKLLENFCIGKCIGTAEPIPDIQNVCDSQILENGVKSAALWVSGVTGNIGSVWAIIMPPNVSHDPNIPITELPKIELKKNGVTGIYQESYNDFTLKGEYKISVYAISTQGVYSLPKTTSVLQNPCSQQGDLNCDGKTDLADVILILKLLAQTHTENISLVDVNRDARIGLEEAIYILQVVSMLR